MNKLAEMTLVRASTEGLDSVGQGIGPSKNRPSRLREVAKTAIEQTSVLECRIDSLMVLARALMLEVESLKEQADTNGHADMNLQAQVRRFESELIRSALIRTGGRQRRAARLLGMKVTTLNTKIKRYRIMINARCDMPDNAS